jgi:hypothetical protein
MHPCDPWHSLAENVHHVHPDCLQGARAAAVIGAIRGGTGGRPLCPVCAELVRAEAARPAPRRPTPKASSF